MLQLFVHRKKDLWQFYQLLFLALPWRIIRHSDCYLIGVVVGVSVVNVNDVVDAGTDSRQSSRQQQNKSQAIHFRFQAANFSNYQEEIKDL